MNAERTALLNADRPQMGVTTMAKMITFYVPQKHKPSEHWVPPRLRGRVIDFQARSEFLHRMYEERLRVVSTLSRSAG